MDLETYLRFAFALAAVLALIAGAAWLARRYGLGNRVSSRSGRKRRVGVVDVVAVDNKRRLVLVRRDGVEHLLLVGGPTDEVVECGITPPDESDEIEAAGVSSKVTTTDSPAAADARP